VRILEMPCYYVASNLPAQFKAEDAAEAEMRNLKNFEFFFGFLKSFLLGA
jgi:hypothetical protein